MAALPAAGTAQWSSRFAFIMAAIGSSVGLGNLWRFSAELGTNGGAAFLVVYVACIVFVGIPVLMSEFMIGRAGQASSAVGSANDLAERLILRLCFLQCLNTPWGMEMFLKLFGPISLFLQA